RRAPRRRGRDCLQRVAAAQRRGGRRSLDAFHRQMNDATQPVDVYAWRNAVLSDAGPPNPVMRLVLMAVSLHMRSDGTGAWPSQATLANRTAVSRRSVITHLEAAERDGWVRRYTAGRNGRGWRLCGYEAVVPTAVYWTLPERPWEADPTWRRG